MAKAVFEARAGEKVFAERVTGDCWKSPKQTISRQVSGKVYFKNCKYAFPVFIWVILIYFHH